MKTSVPASRSATVHSLILPAAAFVYLLGWGAHPGQAQLACGGTIPSGGHVTLEADIGACDLPGPALTIVGPVNVNLKGFRISCQADIIGIEVIGTNAKVKNGIVANCQDGVEVAGEGKHKILQIEVTSDPETQTGNRAFRVRSDENYLIGDSADQFNGEGFRIEGSNNRIVNDVARSNTNHGFRVDEDHNSLIHNLSEGNVGEGYRLDGSDNRLSSNIALNNQDEGFRIRDGQDNKLTNNHAQGNGQSDNEAGIRIQEDGNTLRRNSFLNNFGSGILVTAGAENNLIIHNSARDNGDTDLVDENLDPPCDANRWTENKFGSASQDCIK